MDLRAQLSGGGGGEGTAQREGGSREGGIFLSNSVLQRLYNIKSMVSENNS